MFIFNTIYLKYTMIGLGFLSLLLIIFMVWKKKYTPEEGIVHLLCTVGLLFWFNHIAHNSIPDLVRNEFINGSVNRVVWEESYRYWKTETHSSGSGKTRRTWTTRRIVTVPDSFTIDTSVGSIGTNKEMFLTYSKKFGFNTVPSDHWDRIDEESGRTFISTPPPKTISVSFLHEYDNYISASRGILSSRNPKLEGTFAKVLPNYPVLKYDPEYGVNRINERVIDVDKVLSPDTKSYLEKIIDDYQTKNAAIKQCNIVFVITKNESYDYFLALKSKWLSGNKNDIIIVLNNSLKFVDVISYTEIDKFDAGIQNLKYQDKYTDMVVMGKMSPQEIDNYRIKMLVEDSLGMIQKFYIRMPMATFNSYKDTLTIPEDVDIRLSIMLVVIQSILFFVFYKYQLRVGNSYDRRRYKFY